MILIEEPETNLHPALQRAFFNYLLEDTENKYVIATHSNSMIRTGDAVEIIHLHKEGQASVGHVLESKGEIMEMLDDIGLRPSDIYQANFIIWVEGPSDRIYLRKWIDYVLDGRINEYTDFSILTLGGDSFSQHTVDERDQDDLINILAINPRCCVVLDSDRKDKKGSISKEKKKFKKMCEDHGIRCIFTKGRAIENYIKVDSLARIFSEVPGAPEEEIDIYDDFFDKKEQLWPEHRLGRSRKKTKFARRIVEQTTDEDITVEITKFIDEVTEKIMQ